MVWHCAEKTYLTLRESGRGDKHPYLLSWFYCAVFVENGNEPSLRTVKRKLQKSSSLSKYKKKCYGRRVSMHTKKFARRGPIHQINFGCLGVVLAAVNAC